MDGLTRVVVMMVWMVSTLMMLSMGHVATSKFINPSMDLE